MTDPKTSRDWIDTLLSDVGDAPQPDASTDLMMRVLADAETQMPAPGAVQSEPTWRQVLNGIGGWMSVGGLVAATATGFMIGLGSLSDLGLDPYALSQEYSVYDQDGLSANGWDLEDGSL